MIKINEDQNQQFGCKKRANLNSGDIMTVTPHIWPQMVRVFKVFIYIYYSSIHSGFLVKISALHGTQTNDMSRLAKANVTRDTTPILAPSGGPVTRDRRTIRNSTVNLNSG